MSSGLRLLRSSLAVAALWCSALPALAGTESVVRIEVIDISNGDNSGLTAHTTWLGEPREIALFDDGDPPDAVANDGIWTAEWRGEVVRMLPVSLQARCSSGNPTEIYAGLERLSLGETVLSYATDGDCTAPAIRVTAASELALTADIVLLASHGLWLIGVLLFVGWLARGRHEPSGAPPEPGKMRWWLLVWLVLAAAWTYPAIAAGPAVWVGRHFDLPGTIWSLSTIPRLSLNLFDGDTGWPAGVHYLQLDSYTLIPFGWLSGLVHPARVHGLLQVMGVALSAWAAQGFARALGARSPWDLLAGFSFAFSGIAANALLEGHVYHLLDPWMPLFAWAWWRAMSDRGTLRDGMMAGLFFCLTLLTTAYLGVAAAVIAGGFFIGGYWRHGPRVFAPAMAAWLPILPTAVAYLLAMGGGDQALHSNSMETIQLGSGNMLNLLAPVPEIDSDYHSLAPVISPITLALLLVSPLVLRDWKGGRVLRWTAVVGLVLCLGPSINADGNSPLLPLPMFWLLDSIDVRFLRFPVRFIWVWGLCAGALGAVVLTKLAHSARWGAALVLLAALLHAFLGVRQPLRQGTHLGTVPSAYGHAEGPVLDLFPDGSDLAGEEDMWFSALACGYQVEHGLPMGENCVSTSPQSNPRSILGRVVITQLSSGDARSAATMLANMGFDAVALHVDLFSAGDAARLQAALRGFGSPVIETVDGGEHIVLARIPADAGTSGLTHKDHITTFEAVRSLVTIGSRKIGSSDGADDGAQAQTHTLNVEIREKLEDAGEVDSWTGRATWPGGSHTFDFVDPLSQLREEEELLDMRWVASWEGDIAPRFTLHLTGQSATGETHAEWSGDVRLGSEKERLMFLNGARGIRPIAATEAHSTPLRQSESGLVAGLIWGIYLLIATIWLRVIRAT